MLLKRQGSLPDCRLSEIDANVNQQIKMPSGYHFGITAASAETADSFEAYKFTLTTARGITREEPRRQQQQQQQQQPPVPEWQNVNMDTHSDTPASSFSNQDAQFADLHDRLQSLAHTTEAVFREVRVLAEKSEGRHQELSRNVMSADRLNAMDQRLQGIEKTVREYQGQFTSLQGILKDSHSSLVESLPKHMGDSTSFQPISYNACLLPQEQC